MSVDDFEVRRWRDDLSSVDHIEIRFCLGTERRSVMLPCSTMDTPQKMVAALRDQGACLPLGRGSAIAIVNGLCQDLPAKTGRIAARSGWHGDAFLLRQKPYGCAADELRLAESLAKPIALLARKRGTLISWQENIAKSARYSSIASFAILVGLSAPIARLAGVDEGVIFNFFGETSTGKTTALRAAQSIVGRPELLGDWNSSPRAQFERAAALSDLPYILDDLERFRPGAGGRAGSLSTMVHTLTSGNSTVYAEVAQNALPSLNWWMWALSSSPRSLQQEFQEFEKMASGGDQVRWVDIPVPSAEKGGVWDRVKTGTEPTDLAKKSEKLKRSAGRHFGTALRAWLRHLVDEKAVVTDRIIASINLFIQATCPGAADAERRIARKFGVVYAAGIEAIHAGVLPWTNDHSMDVCQTVFRDVWTARLSQIHRMKAVHTALRQLIERGNLPRIDANPEFGSVNDVKACLGGPAPQMTVFLRGDYLNELCGDLLPVLLMELTNSGVALAGHGGKATRQIPINVGGTLRRLRMYAFRHDRLVEVLRSNTTS
ncbi:MAG: DUF927 domain-containing protein [Mesorhizobium sp.]